MGKIKVEKSGDHAITLILPQDTKVVPNGINPEQAFHALAADLVQSPTVTNSGCIAHW